MKFMVNVKTAVMLIFCSEIWILLGRPEIMWLSPKEYNSVISMHSNMARWSKLVQFYGTILDLNHGCHIFFTFTELLTPIPVFPPMKEESLSQVTCLLNGVKTTLPFEWLWAFARYVLSSILYEPLPSIDNYFLSFCCSFSFFVVFY